MFIFTERLILSHFQNRQKMRNFIPFLLFYMAHSHAGTGGKSHEIGIKNVRSLIQGLIEVKVSMGPCLRVRVLSRLSNSLVNHCMYRILMLYSGLKVILSCVHHFFPREIF